jgi:AcrR family transcriptional regulator
MPKTLFNKSQIFDISKNIIENHGIEKLTIKEISSRMKSSSQPIYKSYESINQIKISYLEYYKSNFLEEINRVTDDFDEVVNFIFLKCKENPFGFKSFFFDSKKFSSIADDIVTILVTKFNEFMNEGINKLK